MADPSIVGSIPEFSSDEGEVLEEVKEVAEEPSDEELAAEGETDTPDGPPASDSPAPPEGDDETARALRGLQDERAKLLKEISELRGTRRELKQEQVDRVEQRIEELEGIAPEDVTLVERVLKAKGYITKEDAAQQRYEEEKDRQLAGFLDKYPEYKPENDPENANWNLLTRELGFYRLPTDPKLVGEVLERAHRGIVRAPSGPALQAQRRQVATASAGARPTASRPAAASGSRISESMRQHLLAGGWTEEEIKDY